MTMTIREQNALLNRIVWGGFYASVETSEGEPVFLVIKELTLKDKNWVDFIHQQAILEGKDNSLMPEGELAIFLSQQGLWTSSHDDELKSLADAINKMESRLCEDITNSEKKKIERTKNLISMAYTELSNEKGGLFATSLERYGQDQRLKAIVFCSTIDLDGNRFWKGWQDFQNETDLNFIDNLVESISKSKEITTEQFRFLARSNGWRFKWNASKHCDDLFGKPIAELSPSQENLVYWSQVYDSVYEAYERPADHIIADDEALDDWFEQQTKKRKREQVESTTNSDKVGSDKIWRHGEVGIVVNEVLDGDLKRAQKLGLAANKQNVLTPEDVHDLNSELNKKFLASQRKKLKEHGILREEDIRQDANSRRVISSTDAIVKKQKRADGFTGKSVVKTYQGGTLKGRRE